MPRRAGIIQGDTTFQAPAFYERLGYRRFGELDNYPDGQVRYFFAKVLAGPSETLSK